MPSSTTTSSPTATESSFSDCVTAVPGKYGNVPITACNSLYNYDPTFGPAVATSVIFGLLTAVHLAQAIIYRKRYTWVVIMACLWELVAFILHSLGTHDQQNQGYADGWTLLFLLAPLWINAFVYMTFARTVYCFKPDHKVWRVPAVGMSKYFVWADVATFIVQATGGVMVTPGSSASVQKTGIDIYMAGLGCQELFILIFLTLMIIFHRDCLALERNGFMTRTPGFLHGWRGMVYTLYVVLGLISFRLFYRIAEFGGGVTLSNPVPFHEAYAYAMDALPMAICLALLAVMHPGRVLTGPDSDLPRMSRKERKAAKAAKKQEKAQLKAEKKQLGTGKGHVELQQFLPDDSAQTSVERFTEQPYNGQTYNPEPVRQQQPYATLQSYSSDVYQHPNHGYSNV
ncbi:hypothetical protein SEUCBS139899_003623 [Sporothrix eucalyptigena]|uniref:RTA1 domain protein n=1 Tax=Sporothrix eucalyptigena TaxID=1812306 RepID=A0ABP0C8M6_9PEZI